MRGRAIDATAPNDTSWITNHTLPGLAATDSTTLPALEATGRDMAIVVQDKNSSASAQPLINSNSTLDVLADMVTEIFHMTDESNVTNITDSVNVSDDGAHRPPDYNKETRIITLWLLFILGIVGNLLVCVWMWTNRRRKSRMNLFILMLTIADLSVCFFAMLYVIIMEEMNNVWIAGNVVCKLVNFVQSAAMMASTNMLLVIAIDRHQAIRSPLKEAFSSFRMISIAWATAFVCSTPQLYVWNESRRDGVPRCGWPPGTTKLERQAYISYIAFVVFLLPFIIISVAYARIFKKIADKAHDSKKEPRKSSVKQGRVHLQSTGSGSLSRAKIKTLKMTAVILLTFIVCGLPFFIAEMCVSYSNKIDTEVYAILGIFAVANSATNPYVFLVFNINDRFLIEFERTFGIRCPCLRESARSRGQSYSAPFRSHVGFSRHVERDSYTPPTNNEAIEVTILPSSSSSEKGFSPERLRSARLIGRGREFRV
ncbi:neuropeptide S receptor-like [Ptychodera flava]|uniref:neuropeptide S receptor-like n=1 Tax=Ptychodera flava TaxID=63121 RepID=UPI00396A03AA